MVKKLVLASASPRRKALLGKLTKNFLVRPSRVDEKKIKAGSPEAFALKAALAKAEEVALRSRRSLVIGADTIVVLGKKILGKPKGKAGAVKMLKGLVGRTHRVITGLAVVDSESFQKITGLETTKVKMKRVPNKEILAYVSSGRPLDKAGAYGIQEIEELFIERVEGDYENVVGLPLLKLRELLAHFDLKV
jgi:septum formation protein